MSATWKIEAGLLFVKKISLILRTQDEGYFLVPYQTQSIDDTTISVYTTDGSCMWISSFPSCGSIDRLNLQSTDTGNRTICVDMSMNHPIDSLVPQS